MGGFGKRSQPVALDPTMKSWALSAQTISLAEHGHAEFANLASHFSNNSQPRSEMPTLAESGGVVVYSAFSGV